ncbi:hypothetical protein PSQ19_12020 [Devosia algicola]|uniref:Uncharacterized protein n=1 Tax=Devosia algicola TaxID=3026418 RepID=A0ABY7YJY1_9HYPH|nr:hypothetical protein [Devosia algicola]WDR01519.1 hypothetical protein PSQ19_12020 [Devosia algicola]
MALMVKYVAVAGLIAALALGFVITAHAQELGVASGLELPLVLD